MTITIDKPKQKLLTFEQFVSQLPDQEGRYELVNGEIMRILPTRRHETIAEFITDTFKDEVKRLKLNYFVSGRIMIRTETKQGSERGRHPDVTVVDKIAWESQPTAYSALLDPPQLTVEVVSTNWEDDYVDKLEEYQLLGIPEYWIIDYLAVASRSYLGNPKQPTVFVFTLKEDKTYQMNSYQNEDLIISPTFPQLKLTPQQIFTS
jgi:Uma2 family endonuclease